jgi:hypothetical protein
MNLIYLRQGTPKTRKFLRKKLRAEAAGSIYDIEAGDCCLAPARPGRGEYLLTFLNDVSPEMLDFICSSGSWTAMSRN